MSDTGKVLLEFRNISKTYGTTTVLSDVNFTLREGEIVAIIGQNGAGKSTFSKIAAGVIAPDPGGEIFVEGERVKLHPPRNALSYGVSFIPQELAYVPEMTAAENIVLGRWPKKNGIVSHREVVRYSQYATEKYGIKIDVHQKMSSLKLADKQLVEILKALTRNSKVIILDEPTSSLTEDESKNLFKIVVDLARNEGVGIIFISHHMDEVFHFSDRIDVFRNGKLVASEQTATSNHDQLIYHMLGKEKSEIIFEKKLQSEKVLEIVNWNSTTIPELKNINFTVNKGEIVGLFGSRGCGAEIIGEGLMGLRPNEITGEIIVKGKKRNLFKNPIDARSENIAYVPPDRKKQGLFLDMTIKENISQLILRNISRKGLIDFSEESKISKRLFERFNTKARSINQKVGELSGGNQQKTLLASRLAIEPEILILQEPTRGVDVGARFEIHSTLREIAEAGTAILLITSDIEEATILSDRLLIMQNGHLKGELIGEQLNQQKALELATGTE